MSDGSNALEGLKLINDWAKWLITIETGAIAIIGAVVQQERIVRLHRAKTFATASIASFVVSIAAAALLLLSLPEIAQTLQPETNIWLTKDSVIGRVFGMNTEQFATVESFFFGLGIVCFAALILVVTWVPSQPCQHIDGNASAVRSVTLFE